ncbi:LytR/AlgR family response regulator transcription factor [Flavilitoribacter nigricans]|uniref:HTH LytTR-type domain-containing protein n=1 Tax=Flavilitoribacter nigricans (strain ATCC 23147 / DSM 23189 / NBRC 102662 / NCIMB 1420 / SS-2) TaxID=1122177 RepID=A0A2D0MZE7_FLAN2|nr:LytTR family DNA-binding domain-containing protein [Flavilitoribacter nigricans]PHN01269.1 hypothetical protein CRP01_37965 [Flavilitoribacter nigricans DSM 23189 = NBRC 102662]
MYLSPNAMQDCISLNAIILDICIDAIEKVQEEVEINCPQIQIVGTATNLKEGLGLIRQELPQIVFSEITLPGLNSLIGAGGTFFPSCHTILMSSCPDRALDANKYQAAGFLIKPLKKVELITAVRYAEIRIIANNHRKSEIIATNNKQIIPPGELIGVPTVEGFEFIHINQLIRLEGMQKYTQIITRQRSDLISTNNIGEFCKLLHPFHFFSPHKSHLINLVHVKKYYKDGTIQMSDGSLVPVAKRRKTEFLNTMLLLR